MKTAIAFVIAFTSMINLAFAADPEARTIQTSGTAIVYVKPDEVEFTFSVHTFDGDLTKAKETNDAKCKEIVGFIKSLKVEERDIQTQWMQNERVYEDVRDKPREFKGYSVTRTYAIVLRDTTKFESLTDALLVKPKCSIIRYQLRTSQNRKFRDEARQKAIRAAREKAQLLAAELNCSVGEPRTIQELDSSFHDNVVQNSVAHNADGDGVADGGILPLGQQSLSATVEVTFDLVPAK